MNKPTLKDYFQEFLCRFLDIHRFGEWKNESAFIDTYVGLNFGWVARYGKQCSYCGKLKYKKPFLKSERKRLIEEASKLRRG